VRQTLPDGGVDVIRWPATAACRISSSADGRAGSVDWGWLNEPDEVVVMEICC
jgi:hypothetical protein